MMKHLQLVSLFFLLLFNNPLAKTQDINVGMGYYQAKQYTKAAIEFETALSNLAKERGELDTIIYTKALLFTAKSFNKSSNSDKAIFYYQKYIKSYKEIGEKNHFPYVETCNDIGVLYLKKADYENAELFLIESKRLANNLLGNGHPFYAMVCDNLAGYYTKIGKFEKAEILFIKAKRIRKNIYGEQSQVYAITCNNLAGLYLKKSGLSKTITEKLDYFKKAELLLINAMHINRTAVGDNHPAYGTSCNNLALFYKTVSTYLKTGNEKNNVFNKADSLFFIAKRITKNVYGTNNTYYVDVCNNLGGLYFKQAGLKSNIIEKENLYKKAELNYIKAKTIAEVIYRREHPDYTLICNNLAIFYYATNNYEEAKRLFTEANKLVLKAVAESSKFMSEMEREQYLNNRINYYFDIYHSFYLNNLQENKALVGTVYNNALNIKGSLLKSSIAIRKAVIQSGDKTLLNDYTQMNTYGKVLAYQYTLPLSEQRSDIKKIEAEVNRMEKELIRKSQNLPSLQNLGALDVSWENIQKSLRKDEIAIEFIHFKHNNGKSWTDSTLYFALVLHKDYVYPKAIFLFEEKQLKILLKRNETEDDFTYVKKMYSPKYEQSNLLFKTVFKPIEQYLTDTKTIYLSTSGLLNRIAFDAIASDSTTILSDKYQINYTSSTATRTHQEQLFQKDIKNIVLFGGIEYDIEPEQMLANTNVLKKETDPVDFGNHRTIRDVKGVDHLTRNVSWSYLEGSLKETMEIQRIIMPNNKNVVMYKNEFGSEDQFKSLENNSPSVIHISTHGFYFGDDKKSEKYKEMIDTDVKFAHSENPLLRSGFILAGGNAAFQGRNIPNGVEDGVLTALEISRLNFYKTRLAVLSACQTGLGDVKGSEGVYGLQRAFKMAGVEYLLFSLWEVPDYQTSELMTSFYKNWFFGMEIRVAFKKAQNELKTKYAKVDGAAFAWAAFVLMR